MEGNSIRARARMTGVAKNTFVKLLVELGAAREAYADEHLRNLPCKRLQVDEIWAFCYAKAKNVPAEKQGKVRVRRRVALRRDRRRRHEARAVVARGLPRRWVRDRVDADLEGRLSGRVQITTDGLKAYISAVEDAFGGEVDYAQLHKLDGAPAEGEHRYSPGKDAVSGGRRRGPEVGYRGDRPAPPGFKILKLTHYRPFRSVALGPRHVYAGR